MSTLHWLGTPSSSIVNDPRRFSIVPSSTIVHNGEVTCSPILPVKSELSLRLKSPSKPCPTASCNSTPGQPAPNTTGINPAGAATALRFTKA